jgi:uncharacterized protein (TIGR03435 family)
MNRLLFCCGLCVCLTGQIAGQSPIEHPSRPQNAVSADKTSQPREIAFDVVSIKPIGKPDPDWFWGAQIAPTPDGYKGLKEQSLWETIMLAYYQHSHSPWYWMGRKSLLLGAPSWLMKNQYSIDAKVSPEDVEEWQKPDPDGKRLHVALQKMLQDRCKLVLHTEMVEQPVYALVIKRGAKADADRVPYDGATKDIDSAHTTTRFYAMSIGYVVAHLIKDRPVIDMTGLKGRYDFVLQSVLDETQDGTYNLDLESVGLTLKAMKSPIEVLVIDHIEEPSPN